MDKAAEQPVPVLAPPRPTGPGVFRMRVIDAVAALDEAAIARGRKVSVA